MKLLVYGALNIDLVYSVDHIVIPGETLRSPSLVKSAGGKGANQAAAAAKAGFRREPEACKGLDKRPEVSGLDVFLAGKIGRDGDFLLSLLKSYGVHTEYVTVCPGSTGQALIQVDKNGQNSIIFYAGGNAEITAAEAEAVIAGFSHGSKAREDMISLQNEIPFTAEMMEAAAKAGMRICYNPSPWDEKIHELPLELVDLFIVNEIEGPALAGLPPGTPPEKILDCLADRFPKKELILTAGKEGAFYACGSAREKGSIIDLPVADTTGAGDTFTGYYLAARAKNYPAAEALNLACKASSIAVSRKGAMESIPFADEVF